MKNSWSFWKLIIFLCWKNQLSCFIWLRRLFLEVFWLIKRKPCVTEITYPIHVELSRGKGCKLAAVLRTYHHEVDHHRWKMHVCTLLNINYFIRLFSLVKIALGKWAQNDGIYYWFFKKFLTVIDHTPKDTVIIIRPSAKQQSHGNMCIRVIWKWYWSVPGREKMDTISKAAISSIHLFIIMLVAWWFAVACCLSYSW